MQYMHLDRPIGQSSLHLKWIRENIPRDARYQMGTQLVSILRELIREKEKVLPRSKGFAAVTNGGTTRLMWVSKDTKAGIRRGEKVLQSARKRDLEEKGVRFRQIRFPRDKKVMGSLKKMARVISSVHHPNQYGFVPQRDCIESAKVHSNAHVVYLLDFENAFDQVSHKEVRDLIMVVGRVNATEASRIADLCCHDGYLYQGNPLAPAIFNLRAAWCVERLTRLCNKVGANISVYADDITISHNWWSHISGSFKRTVIRIIHECGLQVNLKKCRVCQISPRKIGHYDITGLTIDFDECGLPYVRPLHRRRVLKKAEYLAYLQRSGLLHSLELNKLGFPKELEQVERGLRIWAKRNGKLAQVQLTAPFLA